MLKRLALGFVALFLLSAPALAAPNPTVSYSVGVCDPNFPTRCEKPVTASVATNQVTVAASATLIVAARAGRQLVLIVNESTTDVRLGNSGVTTGNGVLLPGTKGASLTLPNTGAWYGIVASGTAAVSYAETY